jgi:hypothetical protein
VTYRLLFLTALLCYTIASCAQAPATDPDPLPNDTQLDSSMAENDAQGSVYVPIDSWVYPALDRLHALGFIDTAFLGLRPWTRASIAHMLELTADKIEADSGGREARSIYVALVREFKPEVDRGTGSAQPQVELESVYTQLRGISGTPLRDSFHLGQTIIDDYGRPYQGGFNNYSGFSARAMAGRFSLYFRGETQYAPSAAGYSLPLAQMLSTIDGTVYINPATQLTTYFLPQATIPQGPIATTGQARVLEAALSYHVLGHEFSFGKEDHWLAPDSGASMLWGNNASNIYEFQINRVEPLHIPGLSLLTGPFRYEFFVGGLNGHTLVPNPAYQADPSPSIPNVINPGDPWVHMEKISFKPTRDLEFGFDRLTLWGGEGHVPVTLHTFLHSFFSFQNVPSSEKFGRDDPGDRIGTFDFDWRLPFLSHWVTLYTDSVVHDDVSPVSAPRRAGYEPGIYLARFPGLQHLDLRVEGADMEPPSHAGANNGQFLYWEYIERQGPTNNGFLVGDWVGRQDHGGQAWLTYHLSPQEYVQFQYRNAKASPLFIPGGTTQNDFAVEAVKRIFKDYELRGWVQYERWKAPIYQPGLNSDTVAAFQVTWFPPEQKK